VLNTFTAFWHRPTLLITISAAITVAILLPASVWTRLLTAWCTGVVTYTVLVAHLPGHQLQDDLRQQASDLDDSAPVISMFAVMATLVHGVNIARQL
jgi:uncharacterized membrane protein